MSESGYDMKFNKNKDLSEIHKTSRSVYFFRGNQIEVK